MDTLETKFKNVEFELVHFDNGATEDSMQCYLLAKNLNKKQLANKGQTALDLGNFVYRNFGIIYEPCPEYCSKSNPKNSLTFYISKRSFNKMEHLKKWIIDVTKERRAESALYYNKRIPVPNPLKREKTA